MQNKSYNVTIKTGQYVEAKGFQLAGAFIATLSTFFMYNA